MTHLLILAGLILPLALDTFALSAALGIAGISVERRLRSSVVLAGFEAGMPIVGILVGVAVGHVVGDLAGWTAIAFLVLAGIFMLRPGDEDREQARLRMLAHAQGLAIIDLGLAISVDELTIGFSLGLLDVPLAVAVVWIGAQAFLAAQVGLRLGSRIGEELRERAQQWAGIAMIGLAGFLLILKLAHRSM